MMGNFVDNTVTLSISIASAAAGCSATISGGGSSQTVGPGETASITVVKGTIVTYNAIPGIAYVFGAWASPGNGNVSTDNPYTVLAENAPTVMLGQFSNASYNLSITVPAGNNGTATISDGTNSATVQPGETATITVMRGTAVTYSATAAEGNSFYTWNSPGNGNVSTDNPYTVLSQNAYTVMMAVFGPTPHTLTFTTNQPTYGSFLMDGEPISELNVPDGSQIMLNGPMLTVNGKTVTASAAPSDGTYTYRFMGWSVAGGTIIEEDLTITGTFKRETITTGAYWSNDNFNGSVTETFRFTGGNSNMDHMISYDLYTPTTLNGITSWAPTNYSIQIAISYYPQTTISSTLLLNGTAVTGMSSSVNVGQWPAFNLTLDANTSKISFTPINNFVNFTNFTTLDNNTRVILDYAAVTDRNAIQEIKHEDSGSGVHVSFSVTQTDVFLDTYGVVLYNPTINPFTYFPEFQSIRLDFRSFAIYGDSFTVNNITFPVSSGNVTVWYTEMGGVKYIASQATEGALSKQFMLSNIQVTWENGIVTLTFVNDKFTVILGSYSVGSESISFTGYWYFTTNLEEPYTVTERSISGDWKSVPDIGTSAILLIFLGILLIGGLVAHVKLGLKWLDAIIVICSLIFAYALLR